MTVIMRDAIKPNLLQTLENTPVLVHAGPFGNIAHGNSSIVADFIGIHSGDYLITEAGFGADMGAERFFNIKCRVSGLVPDAAVIVTTVRALKAHSGRHRIIAGRPLPPALLEENPEEVIAGGANLRKQIENVLRPRRDAGGGHQRLSGRLRVGVRSHSGHRRLHGRPLGGHHSFPGRWGWGGRAGTRRWWPRPRSRASSTSCIRPTHPSADKIETIAGTRSTEPPVSTFCPRHPPDWTCSESNGFGGLPVCIAKTHLSISSDPTLKGAPTGWRLPVREVRVSAGAGFVYALCGDMRTMPGLSSHPAAERIDIDENGEVVGLS